MPPRPLEMAPAINSNRPQTLKQAKKAYRTAGASPRFSEIELRRLARAADLQERAEGLKEREKKKKASRRKKEEKMEKERESRRKAGLPEFREAFVGPSQLKLAFPCARGKRQQDGESSDAPGKGLARIEKQGVTESVEAPCRIPQTPLQLQPKSSDLIFKPESPHAVLTGKPIKIPDHDWLDCVVSDTQIEQELSTPKTKSPMIYVAEPVSTRRDHPSDILACISTQDLASSTRGSPAISATVVGNRAAPSEASTEDFDSDGVYTDEDFQHLTQELKLKSAFETKSEPKNDQKGETCTDKAVLTEADSLYDEYAPSSQDLIALVRNSEFDEFDISTQDLRDLVP